MNPIYTFTEEYEKELAVANREFEISMAEAAMMSESVAKQLKVNMALSELKVMQENGTAADLAELILEAGEEAAQENQGILAKVFGAIANFFKGIANGISKFFSGGGKKKCDELAKRGQKVTVDSKTNDMIKTLQEAIPGLEKAAEAKDHGAFVKILGGILLAGGVGGGLFAIWRKTKGKFHDEGEKESTVEVDAKTAEGWLNWLQPLSTKVSNLFDKAKGLLPGKNKNGTDGTDANAADANGRKLSDADREKLAAHKAQTAENSAKDKEQAQFNQNLANKGMSQEQIDEINKNKNMSQEDKEKARIERNKAKAAARTAAAANFIGMFEAGEDGEASDSEKISFIQALVNKLTSALQKALDTAYAKLGGAATAAAAGAVTGAVAGAAGAVATGNVGGKPKPQPAQQPGQASQFLGESADDFSDDIDPIEAMLSGLAFGGFHG